MNDIKERAFKLKYFLIIIIFISLYYLATSSTLVQHYLDNPGLLRSAILSFGIFAPIAIILLQTFQTTISIIPSQITTIIAGFIFGPVLGLTYSLIGAFVGSAIIFLISQKYGKIIAHKLFNKKDLVHFNLFFKKKKTWALFVARITPIFPNDIVSFAAGLTSLKFWKFCLVSTFGFVIQMIILVYFGAGIVSGQPNFVLYSFRFLMGALIIALLFRQKVRKMLIKDIHKLERGGIVIEKAIEREFKKI